MWVSIRAPLIALQEEEQLPTEVGWDFFSLVTHPGVVSLGFLELVSLLTALLHAGRTIPSAWKDTSYDRM